MNRLAKILLRAALTAFAGGQCAVAWGWASDRADILKGGATLSLVAVIAAFVAALLWRTGR